MNQHAHLWPTEPTKPFWRPDDIDVAGGWVAGFLPAPSGRPDGEVEAPVTALERAILPALLRGPCLVAFSGGRDSSLVLAVAAGLARREGLALPIPITKRYPNVASTDESSWQHMVIDHLGLREWLILDYTAETDLLGPSTKDSLSRYGVLWPPMAHTSATMLGHAAGGSLLTGEGGDSWFGAHRSTPLAVVFRHPRRANRAWTGRAARSAIPLQLRRRSIVACAQGRVGDWVRPEAREQVVRRMVDDEMSASIWWRRSVGRLPRMKAIQMGSRNRHALASRWGVQYVDPIYSAGFTRALRQAGGLFGFSARTELMIALFSDFLPDQVLRRKDKVAFNEVAFGPGVKAFVDSWDGHGVDEHLVDTDRLQRSWAAAEMDARTFMLLHQTWLASGAGGSA